MIHYNVNTAQSRECQRSEFGEARIDAVRNIVPAGETPIPEHGDFTVRLHLRGKNALYTIHRFGVTPVLACAFVSEPTDETQIWAGIIKLVPPGSGFHRLDPLMPATRPWLATALLPGHIFVREGIEWMTDYSLCLAWALGEMK
jgi:hypothetical protein